jgi:hypothetical protein
MGKVQEYLEKKRIEKEGLPKMWVVHSTRKGVKEPVERQVTRLIHGSQSVGYVLKTKVYPFEIIIKHGDTSYVDKGYNSGFGDSWCWTYFSSLSKEEATEWYEAETKRVRYKYQIRIADEYKIVKVFDEDDNLVGEFDYMDSLAFRLSLLQDGYQGGYYFENEHGGRDEIDKFACCKHYNEFPMINEMLRDIIHLQCDLRKKEYELEQK